MSDGNFFDGAADNVFQSRDVYGGVHFHQPPKQVVPPVQVLEPPRHYSNNERQLAELTRIHDAAAEGVGIAVICGAPGSGRTTLCECWAYRNRDRFPDGVYSDRLGRRPVSDVLAHLLEQVGYEPDRLPGSLEARSAMWRAWTAHRRLGLLIDDAMSAAEVRALLPTGAGSMVLVVEAGRLTELKARHSAEDVTIDPLSDEAARGVLTALVGAERLDAEPAQVAGLVETCAGLAAELTVAGAMLAESPTWSVRQLLDRIERKGGLTSRVFDVAYDRLLPEAQACYRAFGAHPGDGDVATETLVAALELDLDDVEDALRQLLRARLIEATTPGRFRMTWLIRRHASTKAGELGEALVAYYASTGLARAERVLARGWASRLWPGFAPAACSPEEARGWLTTERVNLVAAVETGFRQGSVADVCRLALALWPVHVRGAHAAEMAAVNRRALDAARAWPSVSAEAVVGFQLGFAAIQRRAWDSAFEQLTQAEEAAAKAGSADARATAVESLGIAYFEASRAAAAAGRTVAAAELAERAAEHLRRNAELAESLRAPRRLALARFHLAKVSPPGEAAKLLAAAGAELGTETDNRVKIALWSGLKTAEAGQLDAATEQLADVARSAAELDAYREHIEAARALADIALRREEPAIARAHAEDALNVALVRGFTEEAAMLRDWLRRVH